MFLYLSIISLLYTTGFLRESSLLSDFLKNCVFTRGGMGLPRSQVGVNPVLDGFGFHDLDGA